MKTNKSVNKKIKIIVGVTLVLLIAAAVLMYIYRGQSPTIKVGTGKNTNSIDYSDPSTAQVDSGNKAKQNLVDSGYGNGTVTTTTKKTISVQIVDASEYTDNGKYVEIRSYVGEVSSTGRCYIQLSKGSLLVAREVGTLTNPTTSACITVDIPISEFGEDGTWSVKVTYSSDTATGESHGDIVITR